MEMEKVKSKLNYLLTVIADSLGDNPSHKFNSSNFQDMLDFLLELNAINNNKLKNEEDYKILLKNYEDMLSLTKEIFDDKVKELFNI